MRSFIGRMALAGCPVRPTMRWPRCPAATPLLAELPRRSSIGGDHVRVVQDDAALAHGFPLHGVMAVPGRQIAGSPADFRSPWYEHGRGRTAWLAKRGWLEAGRVGAAKLVAVTGILLVLAGGSSLSRLFRPRARPGRAINTTGRPTAFYLAGGMAPPPFRQAGEVAGDSPWRTLSRYWKPVVRPSRRSSRPGSAWSGRGSRPLRQLR